MTALTFDTYAAVKQMKDSGLAEAHAESIVAAIQAGMGHLADLATKEDLKNFATKEDLRSIETELRSTKAELKADIEHLQQRMTIRLGVMLFAVAGLALAVARFFF